MIKILVVEDNAELNKMVCKYLVAAGYDITGCLNAENALKKMESNRFDLIISDIMMPGMDGFEFAEAIRLTDKEVPILFMTARDDMPAKERGYRIGIDDYIVKPFDIGELSLRVGALLRRINIETRKKIEVGNLVLDREEHTAYVNEEEIALTVREFDLLYKLLSFPRKTFSRPQFMEEFWGYDTSATSRSVDVYMAELRKKTAGCTGFEIVTVRGLGYKAVMK